MKLIGLGDQFVYLLVTGLVGMGIMDFMEEEEGESTSTDGGDDLFGDGAGGEMDDDFGGMDGGTSGEAGDGMGMGGEMDDGMGMDDEMGMDGEMDDWADGGGGDDFGMGGGTGPTQELENRIDELENEVAEISSTMGTVRSENEQISAKVDDTEENVRKLLEIYEMVTRGVNPFVDDVQQGGVGGDAFDAGDDGGFGLFGGDEEPEEEESDLDEDVADAEAESFFDDDFDEEFEEDAGDELGFDDPDEGMGGEGLSDTDVDVDDVGGDDGGGGDGGGQADGSTFAELKEEYESGDADWAGEDGEPEDSADGEHANLPDDAESADDEVPAATDDTGEFEFADPTETVEAEPATAETARSGLDSKPYLAALPNGYAADLVVMEWLEFLVTDFGPDDAVRTLTYYGDIGWISESVEDDLLAYVGGFADVDEVDLEETGPATLTIDDHIRSLTFLSQLTGDAVQRKIVEHCAQIRGGRDGIQR